jgi:hypothetical protein
MSFVWMSVAWAQSGCEVDPTGQFGYPYATIEDALANDCDAPGSVIEVYCPEQGCEHPGVALDRLSDLELRSAEDGVKYGPVRLVDPKRAYLVHVRDSSDIRFIGFSGYEGEISGFEIESSSVLVEGPGKSFGPRYADVSGIEVAVMVRGASEVTLQWVGAWKSGTGIEMHSDPSGVPRVTARGLMLLGNDRAARLYDGPVLDIDSDFDAAWLNYVVDNDQGFLLYGDSRLEIDHSVLSGNLRSAPVQHPAVFEIRDTSTLVGRNLLVTDNDTRANPGVATPYPPGGNTPGHILNHYSSGEASFLASSFVDNESDLVFEMVAGLSGPLTLQHSVLANNLGKVISASGFFPGCPTTTHSKSVFWANFNHMNPVACFGGIVQDPGSVPSAGIVDIVSAFPLLTPPLPDLYLLDAFEAGSLSAPADLFPVGKWGVDLNADTGDLDVGFHDPL